jgi:hypothetical protein
VWVLLLFALLVATDRTVDALTAVPPVTVVVVALALWSARRMPAKLWAEVTTLARARRNRTDLARFLLHRPPVAAAIAVYETSLMMSSQLDARLKWVVMLKTSSRIGCPF